MTRSVDDLAADVRVALSSRPHSHTAPWYAAHAALSELVALVGTLTQEVARCETEIDEMDRRRADEWSRAENLQRFLAGEGRRRKAAEAALADIRRALAAAGPAPEHRGPCGPGCWPGHDCAAAAGPTPEETTT